MYSGMGRRRSSAQRIFWETVVLLGVLAVTSEGKIQRPDYDDTSTPEFLNASWMALIPDGRPLSEVTLPGTHNTMALYGGALAECQSWSLDLQLQAGVRFLDMRVRHVNGTLTIHHGVVYQRAHFGEALEGVARFLLEQPTETVLMRLREEFSKTNNIYAAVVDYVHKHAHWDLLWHSRRTPTMGQARGKLIVLQDFSGPALGMRYRSLDIADDWKVPSSLYLPKKWQNVHEHLIAAAEGDKTRMFLTYTSGAGIFAFPNTVAQNINARLFQNLSEMAGPPKRLGIITMDFPAAPLLKMIIDFN